MSVADWADEEERPERRGTSPFPAREPSPAGMGGPEPLPEERPRVPAIPQAAELPGQETLDSAGETPWRIAGEVLRTYIVCESGDGCVWLVDKHAAHERVNFDRLKAGLEPPMRQTLLTPAAVDLGREEAVRSFLEFCAAAPLWTEGVEDIYTAALGGELLLLPAELTRLDSAGEIQMYTTAFGGPCSV